MRTFTILASGDDDQGAWKLAVKANPKELGGKIGFIGLRPPPGVKPPDFVAKVLASTETPNGWPQWQLAGAVATGQIGEYLFFGWV